MPTRKSTLIIAVFSLLILNGYAAGAPAAVHVVSAASFQLPIAPDSLATIFGEGLASEAIGSVLTSNGDIPTSLSGVSVQIGDVAMGVVYVSPGQINFWIPPEVPVGTSTLRVIRDGMGVVGSAAVTIAKIAPAIFTVNCLRPDRGAVLNGVTYKLEPFAVKTEDNPGTDKQTRLSLFATGLRSAAVGSVHVIATNSARQEFSLVVEYSGPAPHFFGLDQINVVLPDSLDGAGLVKLKVMVDGEGSNTVTVILGTSRQLSALSGAFNIKTVAGSGAADYDGGAALALHAGLSSPLGVAVDRFGRLYIADTAHNAVRMVSLDGVISTIAGTGASGFSGDGGPASKAQLNQPAAVAVSPTGDIYIADTGNNRIRRVSSDGSISTFAGTGSAGDAGDFGQAVAATLSAPSSIALDSFLNILIADTGNNRVRKIAADGLIVPFAGTGVASFSGDGGTAFLAELNAPASIVAGDAGSAYVADGKNYRVRGVQDGVISTYIGAGVKGAQTRTCAALAAKLDNPISLALDQFGRVFFSDTSSARMSMLSTDCVVYPIAGTGTQGYSGDGAEAVSAQLNKPRGLATTLFGEVYVADSANNRIRELSPLSDSSSCGAAMPDIGFVPPQGVSGQTIIVQIHLSCRAQSDMHISLTSNLPIPNLPGSVTIPAGQTLQSFPILLPPVDHPTVVTITTGGGVSGTFVILPPSTDADGNPTVQVTVSPTTVVGGDLSTGTIVLGAPAPSGGTVVKLSVPGNAARVAPQITIPAGQTAAQFEILTVPVTAIQHVTISGTAAGATGKDLLTILPGGTQAVSSITFDPNPANAGGTATGTIVLVAAAGPDGQVVTLTSDSSDVTTPATVSVLPGMTSASFPIQIDSGAPQYVLITATGANSISGSLLIDPASNGNSGRISALTLQPSSVVGGNPVSGQVVLTQAAGSGGVVINLKSSSDSVIVPASITVPSGETQAAFTASTSDVKETVSATISAASTNTVSASLSIQPSDGGGPGTGTISNLSISPATVASGQAATGNVTLSAPAGTTGVFVSLSSNNPAASVPSSITIAHGQTSGTFAVSTLPVSSSTTAQVTATSANSASASITVNPASAGTATLSAVSLNPSTVMGGQNSTGTVTLAAAAAAGGVLVNLSSNSASAGVPASITIPQGQTSGTFTVSTSSVSTSTPAQITATSANSTSASLTVNPATAGTATLSAMSLNPTTVTGGQSSTGTVTLAAAAAAGGVLVNLSSNSASANVPASIIIPQGQTSGTFTVSTSSVSSSTPAQITATSANSTSASLTVNPASAGTATLSGVSLNPTTVTGGQGSTGTVTLGAAAAAGGVLVNLASNSGSANVPASIIIPQGQTSGSFSVSTSQVPSSTSAQITATSANSTSASLTLNPPSAGSATLSGVSLNPNAVTGGQTSTGTVTLAATAAAGGVLVNLSSNSGSASVPASITIPQGQTSGTFTVSTSSVSSSTAAQITATSANSTAASLTINPAGPSLATLTGVAVNPAIVTAGQNSAGTVTLAAPAGSGGVLVNLASNSAAATVPASIVVPQGQTTGTFTVSTSSIVTSVLATITANSLNSVNATLVINPAAPATGAVSGVSILPIAVNGGQSATGTVTLALPAVLGGIQVNLSSNNAAASVPASITIAQGQTSGTFTVTTSSVASSTSALITATSATSGSASLAINPVGPGTATLGGVAVNPTVVTAGQTSTGTVTLAAAAGAGGVLVNLGSNSGAATVPAGLTILQGQTTGTFTITTSSVVGSVTATITATSANAVNATLVINPAGGGTAVVSGVSVTPASVNGGQTATGTVTLLLPAGLGGAFVNLSSNNPAASVPLGVTIPFGQTTGTFTVTTSSVSSPTSVMITATSATSASTTFSVDP